MGHYLSKLFVSEDKVSNVKCEMKDMQTQTTDSEELRTSVMMGKEDSKSDCDLEDEQSPLRIKLLKNLKLDPRSPTAGIYRTPIYIEESGNVKSTSFDSPISIYSSNVSSSIVQDVMTPIEPSVNVSGFEEKREQENDFVLALENIENTKVPEKKKTIKVVDKPRTYKAKKLLDEINLENIAKLEKISVRKETKICPIAIDELRVNSLKSRTPLLSITSSNNSPTLMTQPGKILSRSKALADFGSENSTSPAVQQKAQWDKNNTIII